MGLIGCGGDGACDSTPNVDPFPWLQQPAPAPAPAPTGGPVPSSGPRVSRRALIDIVAAVVALWLLSELL